MLSIDALDEFLVAGIRRPIVRLVVDGAPLPAADYTTRVRLGGSDFDDVIDPAQVARRFASGATVVAQSLHRTHPTVRRFVEHLADAIAHPIQANAYLTPAHSVGLAPHADRHDVFVLQIEGTKQWEIDGVGDVELRPGDTAYIPAGTNHSASSTNEPSLHLTIGVLSVRYRAVLGRLLRDTSGRLDDPLPLRRGAAEDALVSEIAHMLDHVVEHLGSIDPSVVAERESNRRISRPPRAGGLVAAAEISKIDQDTVISQSGPAWTIAGTSDGRVSVVAGHNRLTAPVTCRRALELVAGAPQVCVGELVGLDASSRVILARRLVADGLCRVEGGGQLRTCDHGREPHPPAATGDAHLG